MATVTIYHGDGSTETIPATTGYRFEQQIGETYRLVITVERSLANSVSLTRKVDEIELEGYPRGVLTDIQRGDASHTLTVTSPEWYATTTQPTLGGVEVQGNDQSLITDRINAVDEWSAGSIANLTGPMTYVFSHTFQDTALRTIEANVPGEIQFAGDGTVTYTDQLGTDRSGSVTLSPSNLNVEGKITITERGTTLDATHVRVIGAHEGEAQRFATLVPDDDPATYENRVNYTTGRWSPGDPKDWDTWANKDVMAQDTIEEEAATLGAELTEEFVEAETTVRGVDLTLGDFVQVVKPDANLDKRMRVHRLVTRTVEGNPADVVQDVVLSTRTVARDDANQDKRDIQRYNRAFQGSSVAINVGPYRSAVDSGQPIEIPFRYPDLEFENTATLQVRGLSYRIDSRGAASGGGAFVTSNSGGTNDDTTSSGGGEFLSSEGGGGFSETDTSDANTDHDVVEQFSDTGFDFFDTIGFEFVDNAFASGTEAFVAGMYAANTSETDEVRMRIIDGNSNYYPDQDGVVVAGTSPGDTSGGSQIPGTGGNVVTVPIESTNYQIEVNASGANIAYWYQAWGTHTHDVTITRPDHTHNVDIPSHTHQFDWLHDHTVDVPQHTHDPNPGIFTTGDTPSGVDVSINGTEVATNIGTGTFETTVDVSGEFTTDAWNDLSISSDTLGLVQTTLFIEGYDQVGTR